MKRWLSPPETPSISSRLLEKWYYRRVQRPLVVERIRSQHSEDDCRPRQSKLVRYVNNSLPLVLKMNIFHTKNPKTQDFFNRLTIYG